MLEECIKFWEKRQEHCQAIMLPETQTILIETIRYLKELKLLKDAIIAPDEGIGR